VSHVGADEQRPLSVSEDGHRDAAEVTGGRRNAPDPVTSVAVALAIAGVLAARLLQRTVEIGPTEPVLYRARPSRDAVRFVLSLGIWGLRRRTTQYIVTPRRLIVERGLLVRRTESIPLAEIAALDVVEAPWRRSVEVIGAGARIATRLGPLDAGAARRLTATVAAASAARR
jgi:membrane protein YdbS with pleckstrin-like domain